MAVRMKPQNPGLRMTRTQQGHQDDRRPLGASETVWMDELTPALAELSRLNPDVDIRYVHSLHTDQGVWIVGLRCGPAGVSYARIMLDCGYHLEWRD